MGRSIIWIFLFIILFPLLLRGNNELSVSEDIGIRINKDTVTYLCDNFMLDRYLTLADMLSEMPGFSVEEDGSVKALGQPLTKIILEGTGYFFDDIALTVNNFPMSFIDKLVVFDRTTMRETDLGVADLDAPEKKMNIILKKEALEKFRGIANLGGGAVTSGDRFLYEGGLLIQRNEKGRNLTFLAKADNNMELKSQSTVLDIEPGDEGVLRNFESGMNYSIPKVGNHKYKFAGTYKSFLSEAERTATRQTFTQAISPILAKMAYNDTYDKDLLEIKAEINKADRSKFYYEMTPSFIYSSVEADSYMDVHTEQDAMKQKSFKGQTFLNSQSFRHENNIYAYFKHLRNSRRVLLFNFRYYFEKGGSDKKEYSDLFDETDGIDDLLNLYYKGNSKDYGFDSYITYVEPLGKYWALNAKIESKYAFTKDNRDAYNYIGSESERFVPSLDDKNLYTSYNEGYSSLSENRFFSNRGRLLAQYKKGETILQFGGFIQGVYNEIHGENAGISTLTGKGEYIRDWSPFLNYKVVGKKGRALMINYSGSSSNLANHLITPAPKISDPSLITFGNVYLQPSFNNNIQLHYTFNSKNKYNMMYLNFAVDRKRRGIVEATWYDKDGMQYSVPVNSKKITRNFSLEYSFNHIPLNKQRTLILNMNLDGGYGVYYSYQANGESNVIDLQNFSYTTFMEKFWGRDPSGKDFYNGTTGFSESRTKTAFVLWDVNVEGQIGALKTIIGANAQRNIAKYSINKSANVNTWDFGSYLTLEYDIPKVFRIKSDLDYKMYDGYQAGYGKNSFNWNMMLYKKIGAFIIKVSAYDILNNVTNMRRVTTANYIQDSYSAVLGRRFLWGASYQF